MTVQRAIGFVKHRIGRAMRAMREPAAGIAGNHCCITAPIQEHKRLLAACQCVGDRLLDRWRDSRQRRCARVYFY
jgi:hypothetical protein